MKPEEISALVQGMAPIVREYVSKAMEPLASKLQALEIQKEPPLLHIDVAAAVDSAMQAGFTDFVDAIQKGFAAEESNVI